MGILNITPDSFSDGGVFVSVDAAGVEHVDVSAAVAAGKQMVANGALIIDVGGDSTRPGAVPTPPEVEEARVIDVVRGLAEAGICVSIDTMHAAVAEAALRAGAAIINDVSGFADPDMVKLAANSQCGLIIVEGYDRHWDTCAQSNFVTRTLRDKIALSTGVPVNVADEARMACAADLQAAEPAMGTDAAEAWVDIVQVAKDFLAARAAALESAGVAHSRICIDPGPGFGKDEHQTIEIVRNFHEFRHLGYPVCAAVSRKRYIGYAYKIDEPAARDQASAVEALMAAELGASIIRTHNVTVTKAELERVRPYAIIALGCNVALVAEPGEEQEAKIAQLNMAIGDLCVLPDTQLIDVSSFYESEPAYYEDQDTFINAVALIRTGIAPHELLGYLHAIENKLGRVRHFENGPRTCDLDIVDYQLYVCNDEELILPHPRVVERDFVVKPLLEILPGHTLSDGTPVESVIESQRIGAAHFVARS